MNKRIGKLPLSFRLFSLIHKTLLKWVRWEYKNPWEIRISQNWIWWTNLQNAYFIPPHQDDLSELIKDFEKFLHNEGIRNSRTHKNSYSSLSVWNYSSIFGLKLKNLKTNNNSDLNDGVINKTSKKISELALREFSALKIYSKKEVLS